MNEIDGEALHAALERPAEAPLELAREPRPQQGPADAPVPTASGAGATQGPGSEGEPPLELARDPRRPEPAAEPQPVAAPQEVPSEDSKRPLFGIATLLVRLVSALLGLSASWAAVSTVVGLATDPGPTIFRSRPEVLFFAALWALSAVGWLVAADRFRRARDAGKGAVNALLSPRADFRSLAERLRIDSKAQRFVLAYWLVVIAAWALALSQLAARLIARFSAVQWIPVWVQALGFVPVVIAAVAVIVRMGLLASEVELGASAAPDVPTGPSLHLGRFVAAGALLVALLAPAAGLLEDRTPAGATNLLPDGTPCPSGSEVTWLHNMPKREQLGANQKVTCSYAGSFFNAPTLWFADGRLVQKGTLDARGNGEVTRFFGSQRAKGQLKDGQQSGDWIVEFRGTPLWVESYVEGELRGLVRVLRPDGGLAESYTVDRGKAHGPYNRYHENGGLAELGDYARGERVGTWTEYDKQMKELRKWEEPVIRQRFSALAAAKVVTGGVETLYSGHSVSAWRTRLLLLQELAERDAGVLPLLELAVERAKLRGVPIEVAR